MNESTVQPEPVDPLIDEIRAIRRELSDRFGNDPARLAEYLRQFEGKTGGRVIPEPAPETRPARADRRAG